MPKPRSHHPHGEKLFAVAFATIKGIHVDPTPGIETFARAMEAAKTLASRDDVASVTIHTYIRSHSRKIKEPSR